MCYQTGKTTATNKDDISIIFMGTSEFAVPVLKSLLKTTHHLKAVYTKADSPGGRGQRIILSPVKRLALEKSLPVRQPRNFKSSEELDYLKGLSPEIIIVAAYGIILPPEVLKLPPFSCLNVHPSLLPKHRGPSPIAASLLAGDKEGGVSLMLMDEGVDTGPVLKQKKIPIERDDTTESLTRKLAEVGGDLLLETLPEWVKGKIKPEPQDHSRASYSKVLRKEEGEISWLNDTAENIWLKARAFHPWPGCYTKWRGKLLKILQAEPLNLKGSPGKVVEVFPEKGQKRGFIAAGAKDGLLRLKVVQYEGGRIMSAEDFARGHQEFLGAELI